MLELYSTEDLLEELFSRRTFVGIVVYSKAEHKFNDQCHKDFKITSTANGKDSLRLLAIGIEKIKEICAEN